MNSAQKIHKRKYMSKLSKIYILLLMFYIIFLFYYIYTETTNINASNANIIEKERELLFLTKKQETLEKVKKRMITSQYQDRINKEIKGKLQSGEHQFKTPQIKKLTEYELQAKEAEIYLQKSTIEEWKEVFNIR